MIQQRH